MGALQCTSYGGAGVIYEHVRSETTPQRNTLLQSSINNDARSVYWSGPQLELANKLLRGEVFFLSLLMWFLNDKVPSSVTPN